MRTADMVVKVAMQYQAEIEVIKDGQRADGKSIISLLTLGAAEGSQVIIAASGADAEPAIAAIAKLFNDGFGEMEAEAHGS